MQVLIVYGTTEGQTGKIAGFLADRLRAQDADVCLIDSANVPAGLDVARFDAVIAAGSLHVGQHQASLLRFLKDHRAIFSARPSAFVSVSLSMASDEVGDRLAAAECADRFLDLVGWKPTVVHLVAGAIRYSRYGFFKTLALKMIARAKGASTDTSHDQEFTDWGDLDAFASAFLAQLAEHADDAERKPEKRAFGKEDEQSSLHALHREPS